MEDMGALQPGLPSPVAVPKDWTIVIIDLQDCFFTIKLQPDDCKYFAFSIPSVNLQRPYKRYQWKVLPQGMKNSPTLCQKYVDLAIDPIRRQNPEVMIIHYYMDDILVACKTLDISRHVLKDLMIALNNYGLIVAPEKIQYNRPLLYLGYTIHDTYILPPKMEIKIDTIKTLNDLQKLLGSINWIRPMLKLTTGELSPLFSLLSGDSHPNSKRELTPEALNIINKINDRIQHIKNK